MNSFAFIVCWRVCDPRSLAVMSKHECIFNDCFQCGHRVVATVKTIDDTNREGHVPVGICCNCAMQADMKEFLRELRIDRTDGMSARDMAAFMAVLKSDRGGPGIN